ncbi:hypothetical protein EON63_20115 [archaeon]|nr:MAG: hypothetical protein EON63_20115 [archaeon]
MLHGGNEGEEALDRPITNFDVIGIPTGAWSSGFFACHENILPSCLLSFFCPCVQWSQVVVRAQIPLLIGLKNSFPCSRQHSGYGMFIEFFFWSVCIAIGLILVLVFVKISSHILLVFLGLVIAVVVLVLAFLVGHSRTAFKEK